jgi:hypothetical protein
MLALLGALALLGCPSDDDDAVVIGSQVVAVRPGNANILGGQTFTFPNEVRAFGTGRTDVAFNAGDDENPAASLADITAAGGTASAGAEYGSCIFDVIESTFRTGPLADPEGPAIEILDCNLTVNGGVFTVGGQSGPCTIRLAFGLSLSNPINATCSIDVDGNLVVNGTIVTGSVGVGG